MAQGAASPHATSLVPPMLVMHGQNLSDEEWRNHYFEKKRSVKGNAILDRHTLMQLENL